MSEFDYVKYCPNCGVINAKEAAYCINCSEDVATTLIEKRREEQTTTQTVDAPEAPTIRSPGTRRADPFTPSADICVLVLVEDPTVRFLLKDGQVVGRTEAADIVLHGVPKFDYISSRMARFFRRGEQWYVQHIARTNFIVVDRDRIDDDTEAAIYDGTLLNLALTPFRVVLAE